MKRSPLAPIAVLGAAIGLLLNSAAGQAIPVAVRKTGDAYVLTRGGAPYFVRGVGGSDRLELLAEIGGNSIRTWGAPDRDPELLDRAHAAGLSVCLGIWVAHERHGFDYANDDAVDAQIRRHCAVIDRWKDHPAILMWGIGNEVDLQSTNPRVWDVVEAVAAHAKRVDPNHPTMTVVSQNPAVMTLVAERCPSIDILGCNAYGGIGGLAKQVRASGWDEPYLVTEWGSDGFWEVATTEWGAPLEPTSTAKARQWRERHGFLTGDQRRCLGGYAFYWGSKQEKTPTWFGVFLDGGSRTELVETLQELWTGEPSTVEAPRIRSLELDGRAASDSVELAADSRAKAAFELSRGDPRRTRIRWELFEESARQGLGGDAEPRPRPVDLRILRRSATRVEFRTPGDPGAYRLYVYVHGEADTVATANFPFLVE